MPEEKEAVRVELKELMKQGIIRESLSPWNSLAVILTKPNGKIRLCVNYK